MPKPRPVECTVEPRQISLESVAYCMLPTYLRDRFKPAKPVFQLKTYFVAYWNGWRFECAPGIYTDGPSIPLGLAMIGFSRWDENNSLWIGSIIHDMLYRGLGSFGFSARRNRKLSDLLWRDAALSFGEPAVQAFPEYRALRLAGWYKWNPTSTPNHNLFNVQRSIII